MCCHQLKQDCTFTRSIRQLNIVENLSPFFAMKLYYKLRIGKSKL